VWETWDVTAITSDGYHIGSLIPGELLDGALGSHYLRRLSVMPLAPEELWDEQEYWRQLLDNPISLREQFTPPPHDDASPAEKEAFAIHTHLQNTLKIHLEWKKGQYPRAVVQLLTGRDLLIATTWLERSLNGCSCVS
jgi:hypothetical protein